MHRFTPSLFNNFNSAVPPASNVPVPLIARTPAAQPVSSVGLASYLPLRTVRLSHAVPVSEAVEHAPSLASLAQRAQQSAYWLRLVSPLMPAALRTGVQAGPLQDQQWCLIAANSAVAAKLRQLAPALAAHLRSRGCDVQDIRIKIAMRNM
jgi:hypothetical protein